MINVKQYTGDVNGAAEGKSSVRAIRSGQLFDQFCKKVFGIGYEKKINSATYLYENNIHFVRYSATTIILICLLVMLYGLFAQDSILTFKGISAIAPVLLILSSVYMLILPKITEKHDGTLVRISFLAYYTIILMAVMVLSVERDILAEPLMLAREINLEFLGISLFSYLMIVIVISPLPESFDSILLGLAATVLGIAPLFMAGGSAYGVTQQLILRICLAAVYIVVRKNNMQAAEDRNTLAVTNRNASLNSLTDGLTGMLNRRALDIYWAWLCDNKEVFNVGVVIFDIDSFKQYNDFYTHTEGDKILVKVTAAVNRILRGENQYLLRYGGEEFALMFPNTTDDELIKMMKRIRNAVIHENIERNDPDHMPDLPYVTITVGGAIDDTPDGDVDYILDADKQMYQGKKACRNCVVFKDSIMTD